jgi:hypothetical protein
MEDIRKFRLGVDSGFNSSVDRLGSGGGVCTRVKNGRCVSCCPFFFYLNQATQVTQLVLPKEVFVFKDHLADVLKLKWVFSEEQRIDDVFVNELGRS